MNTPLISVIVISFNSSATVIETLESIKNQSYPNIELIVSDDCSTDDTQSVVKQWLKNNQNILSFKRALFTSTLQNGGPAVNSNHGIKNSNGEWYKLIAADDILLPDCISKNVEYVKEHAGIQIVISKMDCFRGHEEVVLPKYDVNWDFWKLTIKQQYLMMLLDNWVTAPSQFVQKNVWEELGGFDESMPFIEDWPFWIKSYRAGIKFGFLDIPTVRYRLHDSLSRANLPSSRYMNSLKYICDFVHKCQYEASPLFRFYSFVRDNIKHNIIQKILFVWNPYFWYIRYVRTLMKI